MRKKKVSTQFKLLEAAIKCFAKKGIEHTKIIEISKAAGVSHSLLLYHFPTYEKLCLEVIHYILGGLKNQTIEAVSKTTHNPLKALEDYVQTPFKWARQEPDHFSLWMYFYYKASNESTFRSLNSDIRLVGRERIRHLILELIVIGIIPHHDTKAVFEATILIQGIITGNTILAFTENGLDSEIMAKLTYKEIKRILKIKTNT